jgi:hypothetical protein
MANTKKTHDAKFGDIFAHGVLLKELLSFLVRLPFVKDLDFDRLELIGGNSVMETKVDRPAFVIENNEQGEGLQGLPAQYSILGLGYQ